MTTTTNNKPVAAIAVCNGHTKDQLPKYGDSYYLKDGQEFILMLYNPTQDKIAAKVFINGRAEQSMLVLKPGQRAWIERFIDTDRKLLFETYEVDDTPEGRAATANNGRIRVEFYQECVPQAPRTVIVETPIYIPVYPPQPYRPPYYPMTPYSPPQSPYYYNGDGVQIMCNAQYGAKASDVSGSSMSHACMDDIVGNVSMFCSSIPQVETGRVEMGRASNQEFNTSFDNFQQFWFHAEEFRLMPEKYRPAEKVKVHCTQCRRVQKPGDVYCSACGTRY